MNPPAAPAASARVPDRPAWWQWPTILALDAPAVALAWQTLFARSAGITLAGHHLVLLGLSVWLAYAADRWIEGWRLTPDTVRTRRHAFFLHWRWPAFAVWLAMLLGGVALACARFGPREWIASLALLVPTLLYLLSHQLLHRHIPWRVPKEICVALILTLGAALYPLAIGPLPSTLFALAAPAAWFFLLALANCLLISDWEREIDVLHQQTSLALQFQHAHVVARAVPVALTVLGFAGLLLPHHPHRLAGVCGTTSALLLVLLSRIQPALGRERARLLADLALLTPWLVLALIPAA